ncbi:MAG: glycosyltransferase family 2 protein [Oscillospiraceae bacterium]|nr:glycosyltransferase family 2 protein [Oscillospiraceae bacterium]
MALSITTIILTGNEEKNIAAAIRSAAQISERILVIDSGSTDSTAALAEQHGAEVFFHEWPGHAAQFNWALDHCNIQTQWVFRLDADERISPELAEEIRRRIDQTDAAGFEMRWRVYFMKKWIRHAGTHKPYFLRLFRYGAGRCEGEMDERIAVNGRVERLEGDLIHYDYKGLDEWLQKHIGYSNRELLLLDRLHNEGNPVTAQQKKRSLYYRLPLFLRARLYFWYRYYFQLGFLDGYEGKIFIYLQAYWYRFLVDAKIYEREHGT